MTAVSWNGIKTWYTANGFTLAAAAMGEIVAHGDAHHIVSNICMLEETGKFWRFPVTFNIVGNKFPDNAVPKHPPIKWPPQVKRISEKV